MRTNSPFRFLMAASLTGILGFGSLCWGGIITLPQLDPSQMDPLFRTLAADLAYRAVQPASSYGVTGFSLGVQGTSTESSNIQSIVGSGAPPLPAGDIDMTLQIPFGLAAEVGYLPDTTVNSSLLGRFGGNLRWTISDLLFSHSHLALALRGMSSRAHVAYSQAVSGGTVNVDYTSTYSGGNVSLSLPLPVLEPWVSYGFVSYNSTLTGTGTGSLFNSNFPVGTTNASGTGNGGWFQAGLQIKLLTLTLAAEYDRLFDTNSYSGRIAFRF